MRVVQKTGERGSLKWLQRAVNSAPASLAMDALPSVEWLSPRAEDEYAEYSDQAFLDLLGLPELGDELRAFWPARGPQWDALGRQGDAVVLVEAKAHIDEFLSDPTAARAGSLDQISRALEQTKQALGAKDRGRWTETFYQYANRIAHLHFLRERGVDAHLLFVSFIGDADMKGPATEAEWHAAYRVADYALGLPKRHALSAHIHHICPDVSRLA